MAIEKEDKSSNGKEKEEGRKGKENEKNGKGRKREKNTKRMKEEDNKGEKHKCRITCNLATHKTNNKTCNTSNKIM
jgi:hypothetical protein